MSATKAELSDVRNLVQAGTQLVLAAWDADVHEINLERLMDALTHFECARESLKKLEEQAAG